MGNATAARFDITAPWAIGSFRAGVARETQGLDEDLVRRLRALGHVR